MSDSSQFFSFSNIPGFDFLNKLAAGTSAGMPNPSSWIAPILSVEELDKRINELRAVQFWLEQNLLGLKATVQAMEVQKMTLSTLKSMNLHMEDFAKAFVPPSPDATKGPSHSDAAEDSDKNPFPTSMVAPLQWWSALTQQFQQIAESALQETARTSATAESRSTAKTGADAPTTPVKPKGAPANSG